jgi:hypothetical protein
MPNERQFKLKTKFIAVRNVEEYRQTISEWVRAEDVVLEIGCEWGTTTRLIAPCCREIIGTDVSPDCIAEARRRNPRLRFEVLDAFDVRAAQLFGRPFTKVYIDMSGFSGYRSLLDVISLLTMYGTVLRPEAIVVKSAALKHLGVHLIPWGYRQGPPAPHASAPPPAEGSHGDHTQVPGE